MNLTPGAMTQCACGSESDCYARLPRLARYPCTNPQLDPLDVTLPSRARICFWTVFSTPDRGIPADLPTSESSDYHHTLDLLLPAPHGISGESLRLRFFLS